MHALGVCKVFGQLHKSTFEHAWTFTQIAFFETGVFGTPCFFPEVFAFGFKQFSGVAVLQHGAVFINTLASGLLGQRGHGT